MAEIKHPVLDAEGIPPEFELPARVLADRLEADPAQSQRFLAVLVENPNPSESDLAILQHEIGLQGTQAVRTYRTIILSGLLRYLAYDTDTQERIDTDPEYNELRERRRNSIHMTETQRQEHMVRIGATELYHFAGQALLYQAEQQKNQVAAQNTPDIPQIA